MKQILMLPHFMEKQTGTKSSLCLFKVIQLELKPNLNQ